MTDTEILTWLVFHGAIDRPGLAYQQMTATTGVSAVMDRIDEIDRELGVDEEPNPDPPKSHEFIGYQANPTICSICGAVKPMPCYPIEAPR